jgi:protein SCO1
MDRNKIWIWVIMVLVLPLTAWLGVRAYEKQFVALPIYSQLPSDSSYVFIDQHAAPFVLKQQRNRVTVASFFFTRCPIVCPKMTKQLLRVQEALGKEVRMLSFTVDPAHDDVTVLNQYATKYGIHWQLITGDKPSLYRLARHGFHLTATDGDGGPTDFIHSDQLVLLDGQSRIRGYYAGTDAAAVDNLIHDIKQLKHEP